MNGHWGDRNELGIVHRVLLVLHKARKVVKRPLIAAFRASWAWREWAAHMKACSLIDPASRRPNARVWTDATSNLRAVYAVVVMHRTTLPPRISHVYLKQRRVVYRSVTGPVDVWVRPKGTELNPSGGRAAVIDRGVRFTAPLPRWVKCAWAAERMAFAVVDWIAHSLMTCRHKRRHGNRSYWSHMLFERRGLPP